MDAFPGAAFTGTAFTGTAFTGAAYIQRCKKPSQAYIQRPFFNAASARPRCWLRRHSKPAGAAASITS